MNPGAFFIFSFLGWGLLQVIFDLYALFAYGRRATISYAMYVWGRDYPLAAFIMGFILGGIVFGLAVHFWDLSCRPREGANA